MLFFPQKPLIKTQIVYMKYISYLEILNITWVRYKQINISLKIRNIAIKVLNL